MERTRRAIHALHWGEVAAGWLAMWPAPQDHDQCFQAAGFHDFNDSDDVWHAELHAMVERMLGFLSRFGDATCHEPLMSHRGGLLGVLRPPVVPPLVEQVLISASDDQFPPLRIDFGVPPVAVLRTSDGHSIFWLQLPEGARTTFLTMVADGRPIIETALRWEALLPAGALQS